MKFIFENHPKEKISTNGLLLSASTICSAKLRLKKQCSDIVDTTNEAIEHLKRVCLQVQLWLNNDVLPEFWSGVCENDELTLFAIRKPPAPDLFKMILCTCK